MDRTKVSGALDPGSIPGLATQLNTLKTGALAYQLKRLFSFML